MIEPERIERLTERPEISALLHQLLRALETAAAVNGAQLKTLRLVYVAETVDALHLQSFSYGCPCTRCTNDLIRALQNGAKLVEGQTVGLQAVH